MNSWLKRLIQFITPHRQTDLSKRRELLLRDPGLRQVRREHREIESKLRALEVQARVRARRM